MTADSTLFSDNDLTEPDYGGQVVAYTLDNNKRRLFKQLTVKRYLGAWQDETTQIYSWISLKDVVIINRGVKS